MRVIGGEFRSRKLTAPPGLDTRPTPDRLRESLFSILQPGIEGAVFIDAYAGSGAVGIEALSRGAKQAVFIERSRPAVEALRRNLAALKIAHRAEVVTGSVLQALVHRTGDYVFLDPPYQLDEEYQGVLSLLAQRPPSIVIAQHSVRFDPGARHGMLERTRLLKQGDNALSFFRLQSG